MTTSSKSQGGLQPSRVVQSIPEEGPVLCERAYSPRGSHPSHVELELLHLGEASDDVRAHVRTCLACRKWVQELDAEREHMLQEESSEAFVQRLVEAEHGPPVSPRWWGATVYGAMAVAASVAVFVIATAGSRSALTDVPVATPAPQVAIGSQKEVLTPKGGGDALGEVRETPPLRSNTSLSVRRERLPHGAKPSSGPVRSPRPSRNAQEQQEERTGPVVPGDSAVRGLQLLVEPPPFGSAPPSEEASVENLQLIRQRAAQQKSFVGKVPVIVGDRVRLRFTLTKPSDIVGGVLQDDGSWFALFEADLDAGTHSPTPTIGVTREPGGGWALVGAPEAVEKARRCLKGTKALTQVTGVTVGECTEGSVLAARMEWRPLSDPASPGRAERSKPRSKEGSEDFDFGF